MDDNLFSVPEVDIRHASGKLRLSCYKVVFRNPLDLMPDVPVETLQVQCILSQVRQGLLHSG